MPDISTEALTHIYSRGTPFEKVAVDHIDLEFPGGQFVGLIGHTGSGKSTLIQLLDGLLRPSDGRVLLNGEDIRRSKDTLHSARFEVGLVFQYPEHQLFEDTVYSDIAFGPKNMGLSDSEVDERVREAAEFVGLSDDVFQRSPLELSGGQKRRVAIAGVMAMRPGVLILDEPTAGLDPAGCSDILHNICTYRERTGATIILVTHDMDAIARLADRIIVLDGGKVAMDGTPSEVFAQADRLHLLGLDLPHAASIAELLRAKGVSLPDGIYTSDRLCRAVLDIYRGKEGIC